MIVVLVGEELKVVSRHLAVVKEHMVVCWATCSLQPRVADQEEVILCGVCDATINHCACSINAGSTAVLSHTSNETVMHLPNAHRYLSLWSRLWSSSVAGDSTQLCSELGRKPTMTMPEAWEKTSDCSAAGGLAIFNGKHMSINMQAGF